MKGTVESMIRTPVHGDNEDAFDVVIKLVEHDEPVEFRTLTYEERYSTFFAKPGTQIEIEIASHGRLQHMKAPFFTYNTKSKP
jgi:hypothetical protein